MLFLSQDLWSWCYSDPLVILEKTYCKPVIIIIDSGSLRWTTVPWFFPHWVFHVKKIWSHCVIDLLLYCLCCADWFSILISSWYFDEEPILIHKEGKELFRINRFLPNKWYQSIRLFGASFLVWLKWSSQMVWLNWTHQIIPLGGVWWKICFIAKICISLSRLKINLLL